jgi:hypothetical protein
MSETPTFTPEDVEMVRGLANGWDAVPAAARRINELADRIEARIAADRQPPALPCLDVPDPD